MKTTPRTTFFGPRLKGLSLAIGLALGSGASFAGIATLSVTGFTYTVGGSTASYVFYDPTSQTGSVTAKNGDGAAVTVPISDSNSGFWTPLGVNATRSQAIAKATSATIYDGSGLASGVGMDLSAQTFPTHYPAGTPYNEATSTLIQGAGINLYDANDNPTTGSVILTINYLMTVLAGNNNPLNDESDAAIGLVTTGDTGSKTFFDSVLSTNFASGSFSKTGIFTATLDLGTTGIGSFQLTGSTHSIDIPEPGVLALSSTALLALLAFGRRRQSQVPEQAVIPA